MVPIKYQAITEDKMLLARTLVNILTAKSTLDILSDLLKVDLSRTYIFTINFDLYSR